MRNIKNIMFALSLVILVINIVANITIISITGGVGMTGTASICINHPPSINSTNNQVIFFKQ